MENSNNINLIPATSEELKKSKMIIYGIHNKQRNMWYIGQTIHSFNRRYWGGKWNERSSNILLKRHFKKYAFDIYIIHKNVASKEELDLLEKNTIFYFNSIFPNGYNFEDGGQRYGKKVNEHTRRCSSEVGLKRYSQERILYNSCGVPFVFSNITTFCKQNNLNPKVIGNLLRDKIRIHKGWHKQGVNIAAPRENSKLYKLIGPDNTLHEFYNPAKFAKEHGLTDTHIYRVLNGEANHHMGFYLPQLKIKEKFYTWPRGNQRYESITVIKNGNEYVLKYPLRKYCGPIGLTAREVYALTSGSQKSARGFVLKSATPMKNERL